MSAQTHLSVAGIQLDIWSNPSSSPVLPVAVLFILHGRSSDRSAIADIATRMLRIHPGERELVVVTFDHRNHGSRLVDATANNGWNPKDTSRHNERHALDMYAIQGKPLAIPESQLSPPCAVGTALDVSTLIDFLPSYLYPANERTIELWAVAGFSLGGHSTWIAAKNDPRLEVAVPIVGCPDYLTMMYDRATQRGLDASDPTHFPPHLVDHVRKHDPAAAPSTVNDISNPFLGKKILGIAGGKDPLVPWRYSSTFFDALEVGSGGVKECFIDEDAKHEWTDKMAERMAAFIEKHCVAKLGCQVAHKF